MWNAAALRPAVSLALRPIFFALRFFVGGRSVGWVERLIFTPWFHLLWVGEVAGVLEIKSYKPGTVCSTGIAMRRSLIEHIKFCSQSFHSSLNFDICERGWALLPRLKPRTRAASGSGLLYPRCLSLPLATTFIVVSLLPVSRTWTLILVVHSGIFVGSGSPGFGPQCRLPPTETKPHNYRKTEEPLPAVL